MEFNDAFVFHRSIELQNLRQSTKTTDRFSILCGQLGLKMIVPLISVEYKYSLSLTSVM